MSRRQPLNTAAPLPCSRVIGKLRHQLRAGIFANGLLVALSFALICTQDAVAQSPQDSPIAKWNLKCSGNELRLEPTALVSVPRTRHFSSSSSNSSNYTSSSHFFFNSSGCASKTAKDQEEINFEQSTLETIPLDSITAIIKEDITQRPVKRAIQQTASSLTTENMIEMIKQEPRSLVVLPVLPVIVGVTAGAMEPFHGIKTHRNSVRILWTENGSPHSTNFYLSQSSVTSLLNHLEKLTGKTWTSVRFDNETQAGRASEVLVHFTQPVSALNITVGPGNFSILTFQGPDVTRLVYLLSEDRKDILATFSADASPLGEEKPWILRLARAADGSWCLSELQTNLEQLKLHACQK